MYNLVQYAVFSQYHALSFDFFWSFECLVPIDQNPFICPAHLNAHLYFAPDELNTPWISFLHASSDMKYLYLLSSDPP